MSFQCLDSPSHLMPACRPRKSGIGARIILTFTYDNVRSRGCTSKSVVPAKRFKTAFNSVQPTVGAAIQDLRSLPRADHYEVGRGIVEVQHQECEFAIFKKCHRSRACSWDFSKTGYLQSSKSTKVVKTVPPHLRLLITWNSRFLRVSQQAYVEAQRHFILSATVVRHQGYQLNTNLESGEADQLRSFSRKFLRSSRSGLASVDSLRRLCLALGPIPGNGLFFAMKVINHCKLILDCLLLEFGSVSLPSYCEIFRLGGKV
jgi:hypothetical protein